MPAGDRLHTHDLLTFADEAASWTRWLHALRRVDWVVYAKPLFGGPERVLKYLSRYTHRVAIASERLLFIGNGRVRFLWKDYADHNRVKVLTRAAEEFLRRSMSSPPACTAFGTSACSPRPARLSASHHPAGALPRTPRPTRR